MNPSGELYTILEDAKSELAEWVRDNPNEDADERITEIADSSTPIYYGEIMQIGVDNIQLANTVPDIESDGSPCDAMQKVIYEYLEQELHEYFRELELNPEEDEEELEDEKLESEE